MTTGIHTRCADCLAVFAARLKRRLCLGRSSGELGLLHFCIRLGGLGTDFCVFARALFVATTALLALEFMRGRGGRSSKTAAGPATFGDTTHV